MKDVHGCATPEAIAALDRDGRYCDLTQLQLALGGRLAVAALGRPTVMHNDAGEAVGYRCLDADGHHAVQVWLHPDDTFTVERCRDGEVLGLLSDVHVEVVAEVGVGGLMLPRHAFRRP
jgi:hypothetical protein